MPGFIDGLNQKALEIARPFCRFAKAQLEQTSNWYSDRCHEAAQWVGRQVDNELAAQVAETAFKAAPITAFCFALYATMSTPAILGLGVCATAIVLTNPNILSKEGKEAILTGLAGAVVLNTAFHVMAALAMLHLEALVFSIVVGGAEFLAFYSCLRVVQDDGQPPAEDGDGGQQPEVHLSDLVDAGAGALRHAAAVGVQALYNDRNQK